MATYPNIEIIDNSNNNTDEAFTIYKGFKEGGTDTLIYNIHLVVQTKYNGLLFLESYNEIDANPKEIDKNTIIELLKIRLNQNIQKYKILKNGD